MCCVCICCAQHGEYGTRPPQCEVVMDGVPFSRGAAVTSGLLGVELQANMGLVGGG